MKTKNYFNYWSVSPLLILMLCAGNIFAQQTFTTFQSAANVVGQTNFTSSAAACSAVGLNGPSYTAISSKGVLAIAEQGGGRIKIWNTVPSSSGVAADVVIGKASFATCGSFDAPTQSVISHSNGVAFSPDGIKMVISDSNNNRVLIWNSIPTTNGQPADVVLGQNSFTTNGSGVSATSMNYPQGIFVSSNGKLIVSDRYNNRVLIWNSIPAANNTPADVVVGQLNFTSNTSATSASGLRSPWGIWVSPDEKLLVADESNNRIMVWNSIPTANGSAANVVIGQTTFTSSVAGLASTSLSIPLGVTVSPDGKLAIGEFGNSRVLLFNSIPTSNGAAANVVLGQPNFTTGSSFYPSGSPTSQNFANIYNTAFDLYGRLFVTGRGMNRLLIFGTPPTQTAELGIDISTNNVNTCVSTNSTITVTVTNSSVVNATGVIATGNFPSAFTYSSHSTLNGTYNAASGYWTIGTVPANSSVTLTLNGVAGGSGSYTAAASILQSNQLDSDLNNNSASFNYNVTTSTYPFYTDADGDGFGTGSLVYVCAANATPPPSGYAINDTDCDDANTAVHQTYPFYVDADADGFGFGSAVMVCAVNATTPPAGYSTNNLDCNDALLLYADADGDSFGSTTLVACGGVTNNADCNDALLLYADVDGDGFGSTTLVACGGVTNNTDCNDAVLLYADLDGDGFGSTTLVACGGVTNNTDCNDAVLLYADVDADGFGSTTLVACGGVTNNTDCNDALLLYADLDADSFGSTTLVACGGVTNNADCNDALLLYADVDGDSFGSTTLVACGGVTNNTDCNDANAAVHQTYSFYVDADNDGFGFGAAVLVCAVNATTAPTGYSTNNLDCNDAQVRYQDLDNDGFGSTIKVPCGGRSNNIDCNDNLLTYRDLDGDGYGVNVLVACGAPNNTDCNDNNALVYRSQLLYVDADGDGYTSGQSFVICFGDNVPAGFTMTNIGIDCQDNFAAINPGAAEVAYNGVDDDCDGLIDEGFPQIMTSLLPTSCGTTLASIGSLVGITTVSSAITGYRIKVTNGTQVQIIEKNVPHFTFPEFASYAYATTYTVEIELQRNGVWLGYYGPACLVSTPAILESGGASSVSPSQCGITIPTINTLIATSSLQGVTGYRFRITNLTDAFGPNAVQSIDRTQNWMSLPMLARYNYGTTYRIEVAVKTTGAFGGFGAPCEVSSPSAPSLTNCGGTAASGTSTVASTSVAGATQYRFQITRDSDLASATIDRSSNYFIFNAIPAAAFTAGALYYVRVAVMTKGTWSPYGDACEYFAPGGSSKGAIAQSTAVASTVKATVYPNPFSSDFSINLTTASPNNVEVAVYDMLGKLIETRSVIASDMNLVKIGAQYPSGVYNIIVTQDDYVKSLRVVKR